MDFCYLKLSFSGTPSTGSVANNFFKHFQLLGAVELFGDAEKGAQFLRSGLGGDGDLPVNGLAELGTLFVGIHQFLVSCEGLAEFSFALIGGSKTELSHGSEAGQGVTLHDPFVGGGGGTAFPSSILVLRLPQQISGVHFCYA